MELHWRILGLCGARHAIDVERAGAMLAFVTIAAGAVGCVIAGVQPIALAGRW